jgi:hypothetical protein
VSGYFNWNQLLLPDELPLHQPTTALSLPGLWSGYMSG